MSWEVTDMRHERVREIFAKCKELKHNETTMVFLLANMNDKRLGEFHKQYVTEKPVKA